MPEIAVDKNRDAVRWEHEVWAPWQFAAASPASYCVTPKNRDELEFRRAISVGPYTPHDARSVGSAECIRHKFRLPQLSASVPSVTDPERPIP